MLKFCEDLLNPDVMLMYFSQAFNSFFEVQLFAIEAESTLLAQTGCPRDRLNRESSGSGRRPFCIYEMRPRFCCLQKKLCLMAIWVSNRYAFGGWVSTKKNFYRQWTTTHRQPTSLHIHQPRTSLLRILYFLFQKRCSTWTSGWQILDEFPCFERSSRGQRWCSISSKNSPALLRCFQSMNGDIGATGKVCKVELPAIHWRPMFCFWSVGERPAWIVCDPYFYDLFERKVTALETRSGMMQKQMKRSAT